MTGTWHNAAPPPSWVSEYLQLVLLPGHRMSTTLQAVRGPPGHETPGSRDRFSPAFFLLLRVYFFELPEAPVP